jgi:hypothetical protein
VGLGGLEPPTSSLSGLVSDKRHVLRARSIRLLVCAAVPVTIPHGPAVRARGGHESFDSGCQLAALLLTGVFLAADEMPTPPTAAPADHWLLSAREVAHSSASHAVASLELGTGPNNSSIDRSPYVLIRRSRV